MIAGVVYMFLTTVGTAYGFNIDILSLSGNRSFVLMSIVIIGAINVLLNGKILISGLLFRGGILSIYMFIMGYFTYSQHYDISFFVTCSVFWILIVISFYNINLTEEQLKVRGVILTIFLCLLSAIYLFGNLFHDVEESVFLINSIYYIVTATPFMYLCKNPILKTIAFLLTSGAFLISGKSICLVVLVCNCIFLYQSVVSGFNSSLYKKMLVLIFVTIAIIVGIGFIQQFISAGNIQEVFNDFFNEVQEGGNGRFAIYEIVLDAFSRSSPLNIIFGHGFYAVDNTIGFGTHNDFLMILYNYGIIGFVLYILFYFELFRCAKRLKNENSPFVTAYIVSICVFIILSMGSNIMNTQIQFLLLCVFWGMYSPKQRYQPKSQGDIA